MIDLTDLRRLTEELADDEELIDPLKREGNTLAHLGRPTEELQQQKPASKWVDTEDD